MAFITKAQRFSPLVKPLFTAETTLRTFQTGVKRTGGALPLSIRVNPLLSRPSFRLPPSLEQVRYSSTTNDQTTTQTDKKPPSSLKKALMGACALTGALAYYASYKLGQAETELEMKRLIHRAEEIIQKISYADAYNPRSRSDVMRILGHLFIDADLKATRKYAQGYIDFVDSVNTANIELPDSSKITLLQAFEACERFFDQLKKHTGDTLIISDPHLTMIPTQIEYKAYYIRTLEIYSPIYDLPEEFSTLNKLESLKIKSRCLYQFPHPITTLTELRDLNLAHNKIRLVPDSISNLKKLEILDLGYNSLIILPETIGDLPKLSHLFLSGNSIEKLPEGINRLQELTYLDLARNHLRQFPDPIFELKKLDLLCLDGNQIPRIPNDIEKLTNLTNLLLASNRLESISPRIGECLKLTYLNVTNNKLTSVEPAIARLPNLERLILKGNQLKQIPHELLTHKKLIRLSVGNNPINCTIILPFLQAFVEKKGASITLPVCLQKDLKTEIDSLPEALRNKITFDDRS